MTMKVFNDNTVLSGPDINEYLVNTRYAVKPGNTTRTGTSLSDDPDLTFHIDASKSYLLDLFVILQGSDGGLKFALAGSGGNALYGLWQMQLPLTAQGSTYGGSYDGGAVANNLSTAQTVASSLAFFGAVSALTIRGILVTAGTSGSLTFRWCQNSGSGNLTVLAGSSMLLRRVS